MFRLNRKTKIFKALTSTHKITGLVYHAPRLSTTDALIYMLDREAVCIAPKIFHGVYEGHKFITSHKYLRTPVDAEIILHLYAQRLNGALVSILYRRK